MSSSARTARHSSESRCSRPASRLALQTDVYSGRRAEDQFWVPGGIVSERAVKHVRKNLGQRLRAVRKQRGLSQERLGDRAGLSGKFVGEVERGEKSISIDSLYHIAVALQMPLRELTDVSATIPGSRPEVERLLALVGAERSRARLVAAYGALRELFPERRRRSS